MVCLTIQLNDSKLQSKSYFQIRKIFCSKKAGFTDQGSTENAVRRVSNFKLKYIWVLRIV